MLYFALGFVVLLGFLAGILKYRQARALLVLAYEKTGKAPKNSRLKDEWTSPKKFKKTLVWLLAHGFTPVRTAQGQMPAKPVLLVFMGGYRAFLTDIFPILQEYKAPAALFLPTNCIGTYNQWQNPHKEPWQNLLTEKELKMLAKSGLISFGALALNGEDLSVLSAEKAAYLCRESVYRLTTQLGLKAEGFACYPALDKIKNFQTVVPQNLPVFIDNPAANSLTEKSILNVFFPQKHPWKTAWNLFSRR